MLDLPDGVEESLTGSRSGESVQVSAWYDGALTAESIQVESWKLVDDSTRQVRRTLTVSVRDPDLLPLLVTDTLAPAGQQLAATYVFADGSTVPWGEFAIAASKPAASWIISTRDGVGKLVVGGAQIEVTADDLTANVKAARLLAPESPSSGATAKSEILRLLDGVLTVDIDDVLTDVKVSTSTVWESERMDAVDDLVALLGGVARMGSDAALHIEAPSTEPVWTVTGGNDGVLISIDHELSIEGVYNAAVSTSSGTDTEITGVAYVDSGPLRWDGPLGRRPIFHSSPLITTQSMADKDAATYLSTTTASQSISLKVTCLPHPGLQSGDYVTVGIPMSGKTGFVPVVGVVESLTMQGTSAGILPMDLSVVVPVEDLAQAVRYA